MNAQSVVTCLMVGMYSLGIVYYFSRLKDLHKENELRQLQIIDLKTKYQIQ